MLFENGKKQHDKSGSKPVYNSTVGYNIGLDDFSHIEPYNWSKREGKYSSQENNRN